MADQETVRLFVSHHSSKYDVAQQVEALLAKRGVRCWIAPRDVPPGAPFDTAVHEAIEKSAAVLLLFCANSDKSRHVKRELILSDSAGRPIIPLRLEAIDPGDLAYHLADSQWVDWVDRREAVMDRVASQARLYANAAAELAGHPVTAGTEPAGKPGGGGVNRNWVFAGVGAAVVAALAIILLFVNRIGEEPAKENATVATAGGSQGETAPAEAETTQAPAAAQGASEPQAPPPAASPPAPAVAAAPASPPPAAPVRAAPAPAPVLVQEGPLQRVVQACAGVPTDTEYLICSDPALDQRARDMGLLIREIRARYEGLEQSPNGFNTEQRQWLNGVKASCHSATCVEARQKERMQVLRSTLASLG